MSDAENCSADGKAAKIIKEVQKIKWELFSCYKFETERLESLAALMRDADSRGILIEELLEMVDVMYWLEQLDWQKKWLRLLLGFGFAPSAKTLKPLVEMYGPDPQRVRAEVAILAKQMRKVISKAEEHGRDDVVLQVRNNRQRIIAAHLHFRSGVTGVRIAEIFQVPRGTAYGWLDWFKKLPERLKAGIFDHIDAQVAIFVAEQSPGLKVPPKVSKQTA
jgi:hypothetical protein